MKYVINFLEAWRTLIGAVERTLVNNVAATVPWLAPIAPAYMAWNNSVELLKWPVWVAWMVAAAVEGLGMSVVSTAFDLWDWNDMKKEKEQSAPMWVAVVAVLFYLAVVITVNVALELGAPVWVAKALLSMLSLPSVMTLALRSQHARRVEVKDRELEERRLIRQEEREFKRKLKLQESEENSLKVSMKVSESERNTPATFGMWRDWRHVPFEERVKIYEMRNDVQAITKRYGVIERTAYNWIGNVEKDVQVLAAVSSSELMGVGAIRIEEPILFKLSEMSQD